MTSNNATACTATANNCLQESIFIPAIVYSLEPGFSSIDDTACAPYNSKPHALSKSKDKASRSVEISRSHQATDHGVFADLITTQESPDNLDFAKLRTVDKFASFKSIDKRRRKARFSHARGKGALSYNHLKALKATHPTRSVIFSKAKYCLVTDQYNDQGHIYSARKVMCNRVANPYQL